MTLHLNVSADMETYVRSKVAGGFCGNATGVIRDVIRCMQAEEDRVLAWKAAIPQGGAELDRGEGMPNAPAMLSELTRRATGAGDLLPIDR